MTTRTATGPSMSDLDLETLLALYPPKFEPMPDGTDQYPHFISIGDLLLRWFKMADISAGAMGDNFIYYRDEDGRMRSVAPDVLVAFDIDLELLERQRSYFIEYMGKPPDFVLEIGSPSTARRDLDEKTRIYAQIGIPEYWMIDATGGRWYGFPLRGLRLVNGEYIPIEMVESPDGSTRGHSDALGLDLLWDGSGLQLIDPVSGRRLRRSEELEADVRSAEARAQSAEARIQSAEARAQSAEAHAKQERQERLAAEAELAELRRRLNLP